MAAFWAQVLPQVLALPGVESAGLASDKLRDPARDVGRATVGGVIATGAVYIVVCSGLVLTLPTAALAASNAPFALFLETYATREAALIVAGFAALSAIGALNGFVLVQGEVPQAMARRGLLPDWFAAGDARGTPARMLIVSSALAMLLIGANASSDMAALFTFMALLSTSATLWLYLAFSAAAWQLRIARPLAAIGVAYSLWTLWGAGIAASGLSLVLMLTVCPIRWVHARNSRPISERSYRISRAALCPGAPVTPPPGCVPDPHIYNPAIGER